MGVWDAYVQIIEGESTKTQHLETGTMNFIDFEYIARKAYEVSRLGWRVNTLDYTEKDKAYIYVNLHVDDNVTGRLIVEYTNIDSFSKKRQVSQPRMWLLGLAGYALDIINAHIKVLSGSDSHSVHNVLVKYLNGLDYASKVEGRILSTTMFPEETSDLFMWKDIYCRKLPKKDAKEITKYMLDKDKSAVNKEIIRKFLTALFYNYSI